jgi:hypothetical protein
MQDSSPLKEAIKRRRMGKMEHHPEMFEHEEMDVAQGAHSSPMGGAVKSNVEHEDMPEKEHMLMAGKAPVADQTEHSSNLKVGPDDDDGDNDMDMVHHLTEGMSDHDMEYSLKNKPKTLGERMRQHAVLKASQKK